ncbi:unnamed protein product, partial [Meganyctiphanes norvegica]
MTENAILHLGPPRPTKELLFCFLFSFMFSMEIINDFSAENMNRCFFNPLAWERVIRSMMGAIFKCSLRGISYVTRMNRKYVHPRIPLEIGRSVLHMRRPKKHLIDPNHCFLTLQIVAKICKKSFLSMLQYGQLIIINNNDDPEANIVDVAWIVILGNFDGASFIYGSVVFECQKKFTPSQNQSLLAPSKFWKTEVNYTVVVGFNGRVWVKASNQAEMIAVMHSIAMLEVMGISEACSKVELLIDSVLAH